MMYPGGWMSAFGRLVIVTLAVSVAAATSARAETWSTQSTPAPSGNTDAAMTGVSCVSAIFCMAVGDTNEGLAGPMPVGLGTFAERWDGSSWTVIPTAAAAPNPDLEAVSCASATFCVAVGETGQELTVNHLRALVERWNGVSWAVQVTPAGAESGSSLSGVSCVSSSFCIAVGHGYARTTSETYDVVLVWNGSSWRNIKIPTASYHSVLSAISCVTATDCTGVGNYSLNKTGVEEQQPLAERWNGHGWTIDRPPPELDRYGGKLHNNNTTLTAVSCLSRSFCLATGAAEQAQNGITDRGYADRWNGTRWTRAAVGLLRYSPINGESCLSSTDCVAAGQYDTGIFPRSATQQPLVENWNGAKWTRIALPHVPTVAGTGYDVFTPFVPSLSGMSCVLRAGCMAVGNQDQGNDDATLAQTDFGTPGASPPVSLTQTSPTSVYAADRAGYRGQVTVANAIGAVTFTETPSTAASDVVVSATGAISASSLLAPGAYTVSGTDTDATGAHGRWTFTLAVDTPSGLPPLTTPLFERTATVKPVSGTVSIKLAGTNRFIALGAASTVPLGSVLDTTSGTVRIIAARGAGTRTQTGLFYSGVFRLTQTRARSGVRGGALVGLTVLTLAGPLPGGCGAGGARDATIARKHPKKKRTRSLWGNGEGNFRTTGSNGSATVRGTKWLTEDTCAGTLIKVARGVVSVDDFPHHRTFLLRAPHSFLIHRGPGG